MSPSSSPPLSNPTPQLSGEILCYILSDIHLHAPIHLDHRLSPPKTDEEERSTDQQQQHQLIQFSERLEGELTDKTELLLILNGDIIDVNGSWFNTPAPWDQTAPQAVRTQYHHVLGNILVHNQGVIQSWAQLLKHPRTKLIYVIGNHDYLIARDPSGQQLIIDALGQHLPDDSDFKERVMFTHTYQNTDLKLYAEHGHLLDPYNSYLQPDIPPLGEVINISMMNQLPHRVSNHLSEQGYRSKNIQDITERLRDIEHLRPLTLFPLWVSLLAERFSSNSPKEPSKQLIEQDIRETIITTIQEQKILNLIGAKFKIPVWFLERVVKLCLRMTWVLNATSYVLSKVIRHNNANKDQYKKAQRLHYDSGYQLIAFGHTHKPSAKPIGEHGYYFNTGSWTPVIQLSRKPENDIPLLDLEETFRQIEHSGVVRIYKNNSQPNQPVEYALETIRSGQMRSV
jgi:predicted phosphodiesterase